MTSELSKETAKIAVELENLLRGKDAEASAAAAIIIMAETAIEAWLGNPGESERVVLRAEIVLRTNNMLLEIQQELQSAENN